MKFKTLLMPAVLLSSVALTACTNTTTDSMDKKANQAEPVASQPAPQTVQYQGTITGYNYDTYYFDAKQGQSVTISIKTPHHANAFLYGYDDFFTNQPYVLPQTGKYEVRVVQPRVFARRGKKSDYSLSITVQ